MDRVRLSVSAVLAFVGWVAEGATTRAGCWVAAGCVCVRDVVPCGRLLSAMGAAARADCCVAAGCVCVRGFCASGFVLPCGRLLSAAEVSVVVPRANLWATGVDGDGGGVRAEDLADCDTLLSGRSDAAAAYR